MTKSSKVKIIGAGPTGLLMAICLSTIGSKIRIYDHKTNQQLIAKSRAYALTHSSRYLLQKVTLWDQLKPYLIPFERLHLEHWLQFENAEKHKTAYNLHVRNDGRKMVPAEFN